MELDENSGNNSAKVLHRVVLRSGNNSCVELERVRVVLLFERNADFSLSYSAPAEITQEKSRLELSC